MGLYTGWVNLTYLVYNHLIDVHPLSYSQLPPSTPSFHLSWSLVGLLLAVVSVFPFSCCHQSHSRSVWQHPLVCAAAPGLSSLFIRTQSLAGLCVVTRDYALAIKRLSSRAIKLAQVPLCPHCSSLLDWFPVKLSFFVSRGSCVLPGSGLAAAVCGTPATVQSMLQVPAVICHSQWALRPRTVHQSLLFRRLTCGMLQALESLVTEAAGSLTVPVVFTCTVPGSLLDGNVHSVKWSLTPLVIPAQPSLFMPASASWACEGLCAPHLTHAAGTCPEAPLLLLLLLLRSL